MHLSHTDQGIRAGPVDAQRSTIALLQSSLQLCCGPSCISRVLLQAVLGLQAANLPQSAHGGWVTPCKADGVKQALLGFIKVSCCFTWILQRQWIVGCIQ